MEFLKNLQSHAGHILGGGAAGGGLLIVLFRDSIKEAMAEYRADRKMARDVHAAASGKDSQLANAFIGLLKTDLESQAKTRDEMVRAIGRLSEIAAQILDTQRIQGEQLKEMNRELLILKGAVLGRMQ